MIDIIAVITCDECGATVEKPCRDFPLNENHTLEEWLMMRIAVADEWARGEDGKILCRQCLRYYGDKKEYVNVSRKTSQQIQEYISKKRQDIDDQIVKELSQLYYETMLKHEKNKKAGRTP